MRRLALTVVILGILALHDASSAIAASSLSDFEHGMKKIERKLCSKLPSSKCRLARPARKAAVTGGPRLPQKELPVKLKPVQIVPTEPPTQIMPEAPAAPASSITVKPPNRTSPINKLKPAGNTQPNQATPIVLPPAPVLKIATPPPSLPVEEPAKPSKRATVGVLPGVPPALNPVKPVIQTAPPPQPAAPPLVAAEPAPNVAAPTAAPATVSVADTACLVALSKLGTSFAPVSQPSSSASCQIQTPVQLHSIASKAGSVKLPDQPTVNCAFALKLSNWVNQRAQGLAQNEAGSSIAAIGTGPGFDCRGRNGDISAKMSEHAIGDAVDIVYMTLGNNGQILVKDALNPQSPSFAFLRDVRAAACLDFATVLGPGANAAHVAHFHIDLEQRRGGYRLCE